MGRIPFVVALAALLAGVIYARQAASEPQGAQIRRLSIACKSARTSAAQLICADPDLTALESTLKNAITDAKRAAPSPERQKSLASEQQVWIRDRDRKCGLTEKRVLPPGEARSAKKCLADMIEARIADVQGETQANSNSNHPQAEQNVKATPPVQTLVIGDLRGTELDEASPIQDLHFSAPADGVGGTIRCSAPVSVQRLPPLVSTPLGGKQVVTIAIDDEAHSYRMFEDDAWSAVLNNVRATAYTACGSAMKSGRLRNSENEPVTAIPDTVVAYSPQGLFMAYSLSQDAPWIVQTNLPHLRKKVQSDLGIQNWITPNQLIRNPYFYKDLVVGMLVRFNGMLSEKDAIFERLGARIFVSKVPVNLFQDKERVVLAGRVLGNKGLVNPNGSEELLPALDYVATFKCNESSCDGL